MIDCRFTLMTPPQPGAIAIVQLHGDVAAALAALCGDRTWPIGRHRLVEIEDIDDTVVARLSETVAQLMPHGGVRVVQRLAARLAELGVRPTTADQMDPAKLFPEAQDQFEALMLVALARAASPMAIDLLLDQPRRWREFQRSGHALADDDFARSTRLNRLIAPARVVIAGPANVGKSTLSNALLGRTMSITLDQPGTTRDYTVGRVDLADLVVDWHDTPGIRATDDPIERRAVELARRLISSCDLLIAMTDHEHGWPALPRESDLRVVNKVDLQRDQAILCVLGPTSSAMTLEISAIHGTGLAQLVQAVRDSLVFPNDLTHSGPWLFDTRLWSK